jgi:hypothetical protein
MKNINRSLTYITIFTFIFLLFASHSFGQTPTKENDKIATFCKVWGFLKYYHPKVAIGKLDWDKEFTEVRNILMTNSCLIRHFT